MKTRKLARTRGWFTLDIPPKINYDLPRAICAQDFTQVHEEMDQWCKDRIGSENYKSFQILGSRENWRSRFIFKGRKYLTFFELAWLSK